MAMIKRIGAKIANIVKTDDELRHIRKAKRQNIEDLQKEEEEDVSERHKINRSI